ncbi:MAG: hypothetical protein GY750_14240 [Lentisphaerae bacterium]|nr:hypothetical protein [Lentisphaerota bacterium]MCP4102560.1 hypothetical protein [Lentisphaerota bacterium]
MPNKFVEYFKSICAETPHKIALIETIDAYIESNTKRLKSNCMTPKRNILEQNIDIMQKIVVVLKSEITNDILIKKISLLQKRLSTHSQCKELLDTYIKFSKEYCCVCGKNLTFIFRLKGHYCGICNLPVCDSCSRHKIHRDYKPTVLTARTKDIKLRICDNCLKTTHPVLNEFMKNIYPYYDIFILGHKHKKYSHAATSFLYSLLQTFKLINPVIHLESYSADTSELNYTDITTAIAQFEANLLKYDYTSSSEKFSRMEIASRLDDYISNETTAEHDKYWELCGHPEYRKLGELCRNEQLQIPVYTFDDSLSAIEQKYKTLKKMRSFRYPTQKLEYEIFLQRHRANPLIAQRITTVMQNHPSSKTFIVIGGTHLYDVNGEKSAVQRFFSCGRCAAIEIREGTSFFKKYQKADQPKYKILLNSVMHPKYIIGWPNLHKKSL